MIAEIQQALKSIIGIATALPLEIIYTEEQDINSYSTPPWISIMPQPASITGAWHKDNFYEKNETTIIVIRKYDVLQPIVIHLEFLDKEELSKIVTQILVALPKQLSIQEGVVTLEPQQIEYFLTKGELDPHGAVLSLNISYAVRENKEITEKIKQTSFDIKNK